MSLPLALLALITISGRNPAVNNVKPEARRVLPAMDQAADLHMTLKGPLGERVAANLRSWLLCAPDANPAMLQIFRDRDRTPHRELVPWAGEFAGKYLISGTQALRMTSDPQLRAYLQKFVKELIATQQSDGYLGPFPKAEGMTGPGRWDLWGEYHVMLGLYRWYQLTGDKQAFAACRKCADLFCKTFLDGSKRVWQAGSEEMNESSSHIFTLLYQETGEPRYLALAHEIEKDWEHPPSGDYVRTALAGKPFYQTPKPRWESLHSIQAIAELYFISGDEKYRKAYEQIWWTIVEGDRHNTGGFTSGEQATGNPYDPRPIETCCTIAWQTITLDRLRLTGDARAADELELSTWNAVMGAQHPSGRWWTYNTPMDGERKASAHDIVFQARAGSPELNCCSVNGPRGLGILSEWGLMTTPEGPVVNYYGPGTMTSRLNSGNRLKIEQATDYPVGGRIKMTVSSEASEQFILRLRIPGWSAKTKVAVNGEEQAGMKPGSYLAIDRTWKPGDVITLDLDMGLQAWVGEREAAGKVSLYHGPLLLAYDPRFDAYDPTHLPQIDTTATPEVLSAGTKDGLSPILRLRLKTKDGKPVTLCDFASAGAAGNPYISWLPSSGLQPVKFDRENPLRTVMAR